MTTPTDIFDIVDMTATAAAAPSLELLANQLIPLPGAQLRLTSITGRVRIDFETLGDALHVVWHEQRTLERLDRQLTAAGFTARIHVDDVHVAWLGDGAEPGRASRLLADGCTELRPTGLAAAVARAPDWRDRLVPATGVAGSLDRASQWLREAVGRSTPTEASDGSGAERE